MWFKRTYASLSETAAQVLPGTQRTGFGFRVQGFRVLGCRVQSGCRVSGSGFFRTLFEFPRLLGGLCTPSRLGGSLIFRSNFPPTCSIPGPLCIQARNPKARVQISNLEP